MSFTTPRARLPTRSDHDLVTTCLHGSRPLLPDPCTPTLSPPEARCMSQLHHDLPVDQHEAAPHHVPTRRMGDARPSDTAPAEPRLTEVPDLADLTQQAEAVARAGKIGRASCRERV